MHGAPAQDIMTDAVFQRLAALIQTYSGIQITPQKRTMVEARLHRRMRALGIVQAEDYCHRLEVDGAEVVQFINDITTNKTDFFREPVHFEFLAEHILPMIARGGRRTIKIWSAASSIGAGAYTCAMVMEDSCRRFRMDYSILATDICTDVLEAGIKGRFPISMLDPIPEPQRKRYVMMPRDPQRNEFRIAPELRAKVTFQHLNLMDQAYPVARDFDVIFCRNILIYFDQATQAQVLTKLCRHLREGGYLILGHSETLRGHRLPLRAVGHSSIYQRAENELTERPPRSFQTVNATAALFG
jgi:chemotaxis protein methyltransferase CheR